uniref:Uncharacterized protein n=1 Tax=Musa acuminata subsp. malaccensis TaxID=214687 RepID=A0A804HXR2_MUSAM
MDFSILFMNSFSLSKLKYNLMKLIYCFKFNFFQILS